MLQSFNFNIKILRITTRLKRFIKTLKKSNISCGPLTSEDLLEAEKYWIQTEQEKFFPEELKCFKKNNKTEKESLIHNYKPYLDENKIWRLGGRLHFRDFTKEEKPSVILPKNSWLTRLIVHQEHEKLMHGEVACILFQIRS